MSGIEMTKLNPASMGVQLFRHRYLIWQMTRRDVLLKYRGTYLGIAWSFLYPLFLLSSFTLVFGGVFGGRWSGAAQTMNGAEMALFIYCALVVFLPFSEVITGVPRILAGNQNLIKKVVFPTEILPLVSLLTATIHGLVHMGLLLLMAVVIGKMHPNILYLPIILFPIWLMTLGLAWALAVIGAYIRDLAHAMPILMQLLMFSVPVFYPLNASPSVLRNINSYNPLAITIEEIRHIVLAGNAPHWDIWGGMFVASLIIAMLGYSIFMRCREEFIDVI